MTSPAVENILNIIALSILADKKVHRVELDSFKSVAQNIPGLQNMTPRLSGVWLEGWYNNNKIRLIQEMQSRSFSSWLCNGLDAVTDTEDQSAILKAMEAISISDFDYHPNEENLIKYTAQHWNMELR
jgi:uncharacterized tellurite resistance protein B-like protein